MSQNESLNYLKHLQMWSASMPDSHANTFYYPRHGESTWFFLSSRHSLSHHTGLLRLSLWLNNLRCSLLNQGGGYFMFFHVKYNVCIKCKKRWSPQVVHIRPKDMRDGLRGGGGVLRLSGEWLYRCLALSDRVGVVWAETEYVVGMDLLGPKLMCPINMLAPD